MCLLVLQLRRFILGYLEERIRRLAECRARLRHWPFVRCSIRGDIAGTDGREQQIDCVGVRRERVGHAFCRVLLGGCFFRDVLECAKRLLREVVIRSCCGDSGVLVSGVGGQRDKSPAQRTAGFQVVDVDVLEIDRFGVERADPLR
ncbi:hypothetical protein CBA19CS91_08015 [Paraburkholderia hospita]|nr:hypothetical protein CBA19CS91_08015 [Paraburkholderia hospita]